jgi:hypothetical protein
MAENSTDYQQEKRKYLRHPAEVPIEYKASGQSEGNEDQIKDISFGGLCFRTRHYIEPGTLLTLRFPTINSDIELRGRVVWCRQEKYWEEVGVEFLDENEAYRARTVEEICFNSKDTEHPAGDGIQEEFG